MPLTSTPPSAPWELQGAALVSLYNWKSVLALVHYETSPVGAYDELAVGTLSWFGPTVTQMWVTSEASQQGGRANWGYPKQLRELCWKRRSHHVIFETRTQYWRYRLSGPSFPIRGRLWTTQVLQGEQVIVPLKIQGRARIAWRGRQLALLIEPMTLFVDKPIS